MNPVEREHARRNAGRKSLRSERLYQPAKTVAAVMLWLFLQPVYISLTAPYVSYWFAAVMAPILAVASGLAPTIWPSHTPPWRTVAWTFFLTSAVGVLALQSNLGTVSLTLTTIAGFGFVSLRANRNARKLWTLARDWRSLR